MLVIKIIVIIFVVLTGVFAILWVREVNKSTKEKTELLKRVEELEKNRLNNAKTVAKVFELDGEIFRKDHEIKELKEQLASEHELATEYLKKTCDALEKQKTLIEENETLNGLLMFGDKIEKKLREEVEELRNRIVAQENEKGALARQIERLQKKNVKLKKQREGFKKGLAKTQKKYDCLLNALRGSEK